MENPERELKYLSWWRKAQEKERLDCWKGRGRDSIFSVNIAERKENVIEIDRKKMRKRKMSGYVKHWTVNCAVKLSYTAEWL